MINRLFGIIDVLFFLFVPYLIVEVLGERLIRGLGYSFILYGIVKVIQGLRNKKGGKWYYVIGWISVVFGGYLVVISN